MNLDTYTAKLAATTITDDMTVGEAKKLEAEKQELRTFWEKAALQWLKENRGIDVFAKHTTYRYLYEVATDLEPRGQVKVTVRTRDIRDAAPSNPHTYMVYKSHILK